MYMSDELTISESGRPDGHTRIQVSPELFDYNNILCCNNPSNEFLLSIIIKTFVNILSI
jgi:hypothetical protein